MTKPTEKSWQVPGVLIVLTTATVLVAAQQPAAPPTPQQPNSVSIVINGEGGSPPKLAVPDLLALSTDRETQDAAKMIGEVLWDDMNFEREFSMIPRDTYKSIPAAASIDAVPFDRWRELGADAIVSGTVQKTPTGVRVEMRLYSVRARQQAYGRSTAGRQRIPGSTPTRCPTNSTNRNAGCEAWRARS